MQLVLVLSSFIAGYIAREMILALASQKDLDKQRTLFLDQFYTPESVIEPQKMEDIIFVKSE